MRERDKRLLELASVAGSLTLWYLASWWGFSRQVKAEVWDRQEGICGERGCEDPIEEYHHIVPERMLLPRGIKGKNTAENAVGLCFEHHKHKWDKLASKEIFYPGVELTEIPPDTYIRVGKKKGHR